MHVGIRPTKNGGAGHLGTASSVERQRVSVLCFQGEPTASRTEPRRSGVALARQLHGSRAGATQRSATTCGPGYAWRSVFVPAHAPARDGESTYQSFGIAAPVPRRTLRFHTL